MQIGCVAPAPPSIMTKLWYCDITRQSDIVTDQERSLAVATRARPSHAIRKVSQSVLLHFRQEDINQNLAAGA